MAIQRRALRGAAALLALSLTACAVEANRARCAPGERGVAIGGARGASGGP